MSKLLKIEEVAERFQYKKGSVYNMVALDIFPVKPLRINGRTLRWNEQEVEAYLKGSAQEKE